MSYRLQNSYCVTDFYLIFIIFGKVHYIIRKYLLRANYKFPLICDDSFYNHLIYKFVFINKIRGFLSFLEYIKNVPKKFCNDDIKLIFHCLRHYNYSRQERWAPALSNLAVAVKGLRANSICPTKRNGNRIWQGGSQGVHFLETQGRTSAPSENRNSWYKNMFFTNQKSQKNTRGNSCVLIVVILFKIRKKNHLKKVNDCTKWRGKLYGHSQWTPESAKW